VTNFESDEGIPCHDRSGENRWTDSWATWAVDIWTPNVRVCQKKGPARTVKTQAGSTWATDHKTWTRLVVVVAARRHVLHSEGENPVASSCSGCDVVRPVQV